MVLTAISRAKNYAGLAKDGVKLRLSDKEHVQQNARKHLVERLGRMRGLPQKLGQMIGFSSGDKEGLEDFASLQEDAEPLPLDVVLPILESEWDSSWDDVLAEIAPDAKAASLGQVHRARLLDGREVAVKVQYPGIRDAVMMDLKMLGWLSLPVGNLRRGFDLNQYREVILSGLEEELDYLKEAESQSRCAASIDSAQVVIPQVIRELTTQQVLVSDWEEGDHWNIVRQDWDENSRRGLAKVLSSFFHTSLFRHGQLHADWHPGNLRFRRDGQPRLVVYDFGCVFQPTAEVRLALLRLIKATQAKSESPFPLFCRLGFDEENLLPLADKLPALCRVLLEPYVAEYPYDASSWDLAERVSDILGEDRWNFRIAGPASLVLLLRAFFGLKFYLSGLGVSVNWNRQIQPFLNEFQPEWSKLSLPEPSSKQADFSTLANFLRMRVTENDRVKVQVSQRAACVDQLDELVDDELRHRIERTCKKTLRHMASEVRRRGYRPGVVFEHREQDKEIRVWLD